MLSGRHKKRTVHFWTLWDEIFSTQLNKNKSNRADKPDQRLCLLFTFMQKMDTILNVIVGAQSAEQSGIRKK